MIFNQPGGAVIYQKIPIIKLLQKKFLPDAITLIAASNLYIFILLRNQLHYWSGHKQLSSLSVKLHSLSRIFFFVNNTYPKQIFFRQLPEYFRD